MKTRPSGEGPDNKKVLFWYSRHYHQMWTLLACRVGLHRARFAAHLPADVRAAQLHSRFRADLWLQVENTDLFPQQAELAAQWNGTYAYPRLQYSGFHEPSSTSPARMGETSPPSPAMAALIGKTALPATPCMRNGAENGKPRALCRENRHHRKPCDPRLTPDKSGFDAMWKNMVLMDEHTWTSADSRRAGIGRSGSTARVKDSRAIQADWLRYLLRAAWPIWQLNCRRPS